MLLHVSNENRSVVETIKGAAFQEPSHTFKTSSNALRVITPRDVYILDQ